MPNIGVLVALVILLSAGLISLPTDQGLTPPPAATHEKTPAMVPIPAGAPAPYTIAAWNQLCANGAGAGSCTPNQTIQSWHSAAFWDPVDGYEVYFGGTASTSSSLNTTYLWFPIGLTGIWAKLTPNPAPGVRTNMSGAWDTLDGYGIVFGGYVNQTGVFRSDTWNFSGGQWAKMSPTLSPSARAGYSMVYVPKNGSLGGYVLLFGGKGNRTTYQSDTWEFTGGQWTNITASAGSPPAARAQAGIAYDGADSYVVLTGGMTKTGLVNDTWEFSPVTQQWSQLYANASTNANAGPKAAMDPGMTYDTQAGAVFRMGGGVGTLLTATSETALTYRSVYYFLAGKWTNDTATIASRTTSLGHVNPLSSAGPAFVDLAGQNYVLLTGGKFLTGPSNETFQLGIFVSLLLQPNAGEIVLGQTVKLWGNSTGVVAPYTTSWPNLPPGCVSSNATMITCTPNAAGDYVLRDSVVDAIGATGSASFILVVDPTGYVSATLTMGPYISSPPTSTFFGGVDQDNHQNTTLDTIYENYIRATPIRLIRQAGSTEGVDVANSKYYLQGGALGGTFPSSFPINLTNTIAFCRAISCQAIYDAPALENNTSATEALINYVQNTLGFTPTYWALGNEPQGWTQWPNQFYQFSTSYKATIHGVQYGPLAQHLTTSLNGGYPGIKVISLQSASCGLNDFTVNTAKDVGTGMAAMACHMYPSGGNVLLPNTTAAMLSIRNVTLLVGGFKNTESTITTNCPTCHVPVFVNEYNAALSPRYCSWMTSWPEVPFLGASMISAMWVNASDVAVFSIDPGNGCFNSFFNSAGVPKPAYYLYANIFENFHMGSVYNVTVNSAPTLHNVYSVIGSNSTGKSLLFVNANTSVTVNVTATNGFSTANGATVYTGSNPTWSTVQYGPGAVPAIFSVPPMGVLLIDATPAGKSSGGGGSGSPQALTLTLVQVTASSVTVTWNNPMGTTQDIIYGGTSCGALTPVWSGLATNARLTNLPSFGNYCLQVLAYTGGQVVGASNFLQVNLAGYTVPPQLIAEIQNYRLVFLSAAIGTGVFGVVMIRTRQLNVGIASIGMAIIFTVLGVIF